MILKLFRDKTIEKATPGDLFIDGIFQCFTLEDEVRADGVKVYGETAIPTGQYRVILNESNRFKRVLPLLLDVPMFSGIRIHPGNTHEDTHGCILVGARKSGPDKKNTAPIVTDSALAFGFLFKRLEVAFNAGEEIIIDVRNASAGDKNKPSHLRKGVGDDLSFNFN